MDLDYSNYSPLGGLGLLLQCLFYLLSPLMLIWSVNTLFNCGIEISFKTWAAGMILIVLCRIHLRGNCRAEEFYDRSEYEEYDDEEFDEDDDDEEGFAKREKERRKGKLIVYPEKKDPKNVPPEK
jgi:hypothetical protein